MGNSKLEAALKKRSPQSTGRSALMSGNAAETSALWFGWTHSSDSGPACFQYGLARPGDRGLVFLNFN